MCTRRIKLRYFAYLLSLDVSEIGVTACFSQWARLTPRNGTRPDPLLIVCAMDCSWLCITTPHPPALDFGPWGTIWAGQAVYRLYVIYHTTRVRYLRPSWRGGAHAGRWAGGACDLCDSGRTGNALCSKRRSPFNQDKYSFTAYSGNKYSLLAGSYSPIRRIRRQPSYQRSSDPG